MSEATTSRYCPHCRKDVKVTKRGNCPLCSAFLPKPKGPSKKNRLAQP